MTSIVKASVQTNLKRCLPYSVHHCLDLSFGLKNYLQSGRSFKTRAFLQVMYPFKWAHLVHHVPLLLVLTLPFLQRQALGASSIGGLYAALAKETLAALLSMAGALTSCLLLALLRVALLGRPSFLSLLSPCLSPSLHRVHSVLSSPMSICWVGTLAKAT